MDSFEERLCKLCCQSVPSLENRSDRNDNKKVSIASQPLTDHSHDFNSFASLIHQSPPMYKGAKAVDRH